jgi:hypothetical protein
MLYILEITPTVWKVIVLLYALLNQVLQLFTACDVVR